MIYYSLTWPDQLNQPSWYFLLVRDLHTWIKYYLEVQSLTDLKRIPDYTGKKNHSRFWLKDRHKHNWQKENYNTGWSPYFQSAIPSCHVCLNVIMVIALKFKIKFGQHFMSINFKLKPEKFVFLKKEKKRKEKEFNIKFGLLFYCPWPCV